MWRKEDITYEMFGINPAQFYATKFASQMIFDPATYPAHAMLGVEMTKFSLLVDAAKAATGGKLAPCILDVGCGSGRFGAWVRHALPDCELHGIDMSADCLEICLQHGYDRLHQDDFIERLPFDDGMFDFVYSIDLFGHIEFRHKDRVLAELRRITKAGGAHFHGIESGWVDYGKGDPKDAGNIIRKYVHVDGHIGVESLDDVVGRFSKHFAVTAAYPLLIRPILPIVSVLANKSWGESFNRDVAPVDVPHGRALANAALGHVNNEMIMTLRTMLGDVMTTAEIEKRTIPGPVRDQLTILANYGGFMILRAALA